MKVAIATDDGRVVSQHFGRALQYAVVTVENGRIVASELRAKDSNHGRGDHEHDASEPGGSRGPEHTGPEAQARHTLMLASIEDCACVVAGGIGWGARDQMSALGITPIVTTLTSVEDAARACATGEIENIAQPLAREASGR